MELSKELLMQTTVPDWCNPLVAGRNKEVARATFIPFADVECAQAALRELVLDWEKSSYVRRLDGDWRFVCVANPAASPVDFPQVGYDDSGWDLVPVPSNWQ